MEPLHAVALVVFVLSLSAAAALELVGTRRFFLYLRTLVRRQPPNAAPRQPKS